MDTKVLLIFAAIWIITFIPSWMLLLRLVALTASNSTRTPQFIAVFILYRLLIIAPYIYLLIAGAESLPSVLRMFIVGFIVAGLLFSILRIFFKDNIIKVLWQLYAFVYDGLLHFYPYQHLQKLMVSTTNPKEGDNILDLGCGTGNTTIALLKKQPTISIYSVDSSSIMLRQLKKKTKYNTVTVVQSEAVDYLLVQQSEVFDKIVLTNVLYAVSDRATLWRESLRVLAPNGKIIVTNSDTSGSRAIISEHLSQKSWITLLGPRLIAVFIIDYFISELSKTGQFSFVSQEQLIAEVDDAGGIYTFVTRCYGGEKSGVNLLFTVTKKA